MQTLTARSSAVSTARLTQWSSDPTDELDFEQFLGLRDTPNRPSPPLARMILIRWGTRTVALTEGGRSCPRRVDILPGPAALGDPSTTPARKRSGAVGRAASLSAAQSQGLPSDNEDLLTTRAAAAYCGYRDAAGIRKAKFDGLLAPAAIGARRAMFWRRSDLDDHNRRRGVVPVPRERGGDPAPTSPVGEALLTGPADAGSPVEARPAAPSPTREPVVAGPSATPTPNDEQAPVDVATQGAPTRPAPSECVVPGFLSAAPLKEEHVAGESNDAAPAAATDDHAGRTAARLVVGSMPSTLRWGALASVLSVVLAPRTTVGLPSLADPTRSATGAPIEPAIRRLRRETGVPYRGTALARDRRLAAG
ncbi:MAG: hypothetical protein Q8S73_41910 [Deltaproteobacteria bacterium]|nr:hypothetical protein [Myxococcales bacterium]MDP3220717.1 hypothetical protein [Deltaproteobacteria bacterium]